MRNLLTPCINSVSAAKKFLECPERFRYEYGERYRPAFEGFALGFGGALHVLLKAYYLGWKDEERNGDALLMKEALAELSAEMLEKVSSESERDRVDEQLAMLHGITAAYPDWAQKKDATFSTVLKDRVEEMQHLFGYNYVPDSVFMIGEGSREGKWVMDHKSYSLGHSESYAATGMFDPQSLEYVAGEQALGIVFNLIGKTAIRRRQKESRESFIKRVEEEYSLNPEKYFSRVWHRIPNPGPALLSFVKGVEAMRAAQEQTALMVQAQTGDATYVKNAHACLSRQRCPFLAACQGEQDAHLMFARKEPFIGSRNQDDPTAATPPRPATAALEGFVDAIVESRAD